MTQHPGDLGVDYASIELRVLALFTDHGVERHCRLAAKEECFNALMSPTGRRRASHPEIQRA